LFLLFHNGSTIDVLRSTGHRNSRTERIVLSYTTILETYSLEDILELNDLTAEECLEFLVDEGYIDLPEIKPLDFE